MSIPKYADRELNKAHKALHDQLKIYLSACYQAKNCVTAVEESISKRLLPALENNLISDIMKNGKHEIQSGDNRGTPLLITDNVVFTNYAGTQRLNYTPSEEKYDLVTEAKKLHLMIDDYLSMSPRDFSKKHFKEPRAKGVDVLLSHLTQALENSTFVGDYFAPKVVTGDIEFSYNTIYAVHQFWEANPEIYPPSKIKNGQLYYDDMPIEAVRATVGFNRATEDENYRLTNICLEVSINEEKGLFRILKVDPKNAVEFGDRFTKLMYSEAKKEFEKHKPPKKNGFSFDV